MALWSTKAEIQNVRDLKPGDHICYQASTLRFIEHHAIVKKVIDDETVEVIHYSGPPADNREAISSSSSSSWLLSSSNKSAAEIRRDRVNLSKLASKKKLYRIDYKEENTLDTVVAQAESRIGAHGLQSQEYHLFKNNCEHFATWCKTGKAYSTQSGSEQSIKGKKRELILGKIMNRLTLGLL